MYIHERISINGFPYMWISIYGYTYFWFRLARLAGRWRRPGYLATGASPAWPIDDVSGLNSIHDGSGLDSIPAWLPGRWCQPGLADR